MKLAYLDCASGASGDMILGALVDAGVEIDLLNQTAASLGLSGCHLAAEPVRRGGFRGIQVRVDVGSAQPVRHLAEILDLVAQSGLSERAKARVERIFRRLGEAEAKVHGIPLEEVHFHELGAVDTIVDVAGAVVGFERLGVERIVASPLPVGAGRIEMVHGAVSVPAPAVAELLRGVPLAESKVEAELTTPTGAAILTTLAERFGPLPAMTIERIGCGAGGRELAEQPNLLRLIIGEAAEAAQVSGSPGVEADEVMLLETNIDNASGEAIGHAIDQLWRSGALDVWTTPIAMKKNRPGVLLSALCRPEDAGRLETIVFEETPTLGVRCRPVRRHILPRESHEVTTPWGTVRGKVRRLPDGSERFSPEYESCREVAERCGVSLEEIQKAAREAFT
jgi:pyridinium-3,5-bisthiocarboxylic acid mononucleotide nickel chelatase